MTLLLITTQIKAMLYLWLLCRCKVAVYTHDYFSMSRLKLQLIHICFHQVGLPPSLYSPWPLCPATSTSLQIRISLLSFVSLIAFYLAKRKQVIVTHLLFLTNIFQCSPYCRSKSPFCIFLFHKIAESMTIPLWVLYSPIQKELWLSL